MIPFASSFLVSTALTGPWGALVYTASSTQGGSTTPYNAIFASETFDVGDWHSVSVNPERVTVPTGVSLARVISNAHFVADDAAEHNKNGATFKGMGKADSETYVNIASAPIAVTAGDYFTTKITHGLSSSHLTGDTATWMAVEPLPAGLKYALVYKSAGQSLVSSTSTPLTFNNEVVDTDGWHDNVTNNSRLTVPSGVALVRLSGNANGTDAANGVQFSLNFWKNGAAYRGMTAKDTDTTGDDFVNLIGPPLIVTPGDYFELVAFASATTVPAVDSCWFAIEEVPASTKYALVYKTAAQTCSNSGFTVLTWDAEVADASGMHDNVTNNSRLVVPAGCTRARPCFGIRSGNFAGSQYVKTRKNGVDYQGQAYAVSDTGGTDAISGMGAWVPVKPGDYFELLYFPNATSDVSTDNDSYFCLECQ